MVKSPGAPLAALFAFIIAAQLSFAVETRIWDQSDLADFLAGTPTNLSIRSDGRLTLATSIRELDSTSVPYLWALAQDASGTIFYAGGAPTGATAKVFSFGPQGKSRVVAEIPGLEIHALAIDKENRLYAAVLPDAKIYRVSKDGKPELFFDPKCKYIWAMAFDRSGNLFVATGDSGIIYRVAPDGKGSKFFDSEETHVRSMIIDSQGNLIAGTEPSGLVVRITPAGEGFVLYETDRREVTAVAEENGLIYAASVGSRTAPPVVTGPKPVLPTSKAPVTAAGVARSGSAPPSLPPSVGSLSAQIQGGSAVYRIGHDGFADQIWQSPSALAYAIAFDASGRPLIGTGNKGTIYRIDSEQRWTQLLTAPPTQVTAFLQKEKGSAYAITGNVGNLYLLGSEADSSGTLISDVLDAHEFAYWGKAHVHSELRGGSVTLETRSGNLSNPENKWSSWAPVSLSNEAGQVQSPAARFLQYRVTLKAPSKTAKQGEMPPEVSAIDIAYLPKNIAPRIRAVEASPVNYREAPSSNLLEENVNDAGSPKSLTVPAVGQRRSTLPSPSALENASAATLQYRKGFLTLRWSASDPNDDSVAFKVELRSKGELGWRVLQDRLTDRYYSFDTAAFPDGEYVARVTASDAPGNIPSEALTGSLESDSFQIDNTAPEVVSLRTEKAGTGRKVSFTARDASSWINKAEYSIGGGEWILLNPVNRVTDSQLLNYQLQAENGRALSVRVFDGNDNVTVRQIPNG